MALEFVYLMWHNAAPMEFRPNADKKATFIRFVEGSLCKFVEKQGKTELHIGTPKDRPLSQRKFILLMRKVIATAKQNRLSSITLDWKDIRSLAPQELSDAQVGEIAGTAFVMADFEFNKYKKKPKDGFASVASVAVLHASAAAKEGFSKGAIIGEEVNVCRTLANTPGGDMTPKHLAAAAKAAVRGTKAEVSVLGRDQMQELGMGAVLGMAKGSSEEPQFIIMEYWGAGRPSTSSAVSGQSKPVVLIGKGVTFDTGGLNIKPGDNMLEMHMDMSGGAAVIHAVALAAKLKIKANVIGLVPSVENMPSGEALRPGDIVKSLSGRTIEVLNTDAEGRVILADAITYAKRYKPAVVVENSTLTGAILIAIGQQASGLMTKDPALQEELMRLGEESGDYLWPFPQWEEYEPMVKGAFGDVANIPASGNTRYAGVSASGMFLQEFAKDLPCSFAHLDIASRMTAAPGEHLAKGAAGAPVRLFLKLIESYQNY